MSRVIINRDTGERYTVRRTDGVTERRLYPEEEVSPEEFEQIKKSNQAAWRKNTGLGRFLEESKKGETRPARPGTDEEDTTGFENPLTNKILENLQNPSVSQRIRDITRRRWSRQNLPNNTRQGLPSSAMFLKDPANLSELQKRIIPTGTLIVGNHSQIASTTIYIKAPNALYKLNATLASI